MNDVTPYRARLLVINLTTREETAPPHKDSGL